MKLIKYGLLAFISLTLWACSSIPSLPEVGGYKMFTIPSTNYEAGYLVAIWSDPPKEDIIFRPSLQEDVLIESKSVNLSQQATSATKAEIEAKLEQVAEGKLEAGFTKALKFQYTNTRVVDAEHSKLYRDLINSLQASPEEKDFIKKLTQRRFFGIMPPRAQLDVLTGILIADVEFEIDRGHGVGVNVSTNELIDLLGADFQKAGDSNSKVVGKNVVIGYRADPNMVSILKEQF